MKLAIAAALLIGDRRAGRRPSGGRRRSYRRLSQPTLTRRQGLLRRAGLRAGALARAAGRPDRGRGRRQVVAGRARQLAAADRRERARLPDAGGCQAALHHPPQHFGLGSVFSPKLRLARTPGRGGPARACGETVRQSGSDLSAKRRPGPRAPGACRRRRAPLRAGRGASGGRDRGAGAPGADPSLLPLTEAKGGCARMRRDRHFERLPMPALAALVLGLQLLCLAHIVKTGRGCQWLFVIMALPLVGCLAYLLLELLARSRPQPRRPAGGARPRRGDRPGARPARSDRAARRGGHGREPGRARGGMPAPRAAADARRLFESCLAGVHASDHVLMLGLARAQFALEDYAGACATLDRLRAAHPDLACPDGHLLYARSREQRGEVEQALIEYAALAEYYPGGEARCRLALLLQKTGRVAEARTLFQQVVAIGRAGDQALLPHRARLVSGRAPEPRRLARTSSARRRLCPEGLVPAPEACQ